MELQQLRYFAIAAKYQHITRAANELHVAQPAVSGTIKRLENELGVSLFEKNGRNIALTREGELFYGKIKKILNELDHLPEVLRNEKNRRENTVKINVRAASLLLTEAIISAGRICLGLSSSTLSCRSFLNSSSERASF